VAPEGIIPLMVAVNVVLVPVGQAAEMPLPKHIRYDTPAAYPLPERVTVVPAGPPAGVTVRLATTTSNCAEMMKFDRSWEMST
jgi:hypothetical protein